MEQFEKAFIKVIEELGNPKHIKPEKEVIEGKKIPRNKYFHLLLDD